VSFLAKRLENVTTEGAGMTNENNNETNEHDRVEVRQGRTSGTVRYILIISMILIVVAGFFILV
jgi:hypothetical protein